MGSRLARIGLFEAIEGTVSDVRLARATIISNGGPRVISYECLFRISGTPVALRVTDPVFIEDGESVRVVGRHNEKGVFDAVAYHNRASKVSGNYGAGTVEKLVALGIAITGGIMAFLAAPFTSLIFHGNLFFAHPLSLVFALVGVPFL